MRPSKELAASFATATTVCTLLYLLPLPGPRYYPLDDAWRMENIAGEPSMGWYAHALLALLGGSIAGILAWAIARRRGQQDAGTASFRAAALLILAVSIAAAAVLAYREFGGHA